MPVVSTISQADLAIAFLLAIPLGLAALIFLLAAVMVAALAGCTAAKWALRRANAAVLGSASGL
ncbi:MAG: hypothetical protein AB7V58_00540 [Solirubrobacterales bacterium]